MSSSLTAHAFNPNQKLRWSKKRSHSYSETSIGEPGTKYAASIKWYNIVLDNSSDSNSCSATEHDTESVYSLQDKETDIAHDTTDTTGASESECDVVVEFDIESSSSECSDTETKTFWFGQDQTSSGTDDMLSADVLAAIVCREAGGSLDSSSGASGSSGDTDGETEAEVKKETVAPGLRACMRCGAKNSILFRYCDKCYQVRKRFLPPRPRRFRKATPTSLTQKVISDISHKSSAINPIQTSLSEPVKLDDLIRTDSDQPSASEPLKFDNLLTVDSGISTGQMSSSEGHLSDKGSSQETELPNPVETSTKINITPVDLKESDLCITCSSNPKNGIFVHGAIAHQCCCYKCALKVWTTTKKCPICNAKVKNVLKGFFY